MAKLFISYSHRDEQYKEELEEHLASLRRSGALETWHDRRIEPGEAWDRTIREELEAADIILLLVSSTFIDSDYCHDVEIRRALERDRAGEARVIPVIVRTCHWQETPLGALQALPTDGRAISSFADKDAAYTEIARKIGSLVSASERNEHHMGEAVASSLASMPPFDPSIGQTSAVVERPLGASPSSMAGVRIRRTFSDVDKQDLIEETMQSLVTIFEERLQQLKEAHDGVETRSRSDASRYTAAVFVGGAERAACTFWRGGMSSVGGIAYVDRYGVTRDNEYNGELVVEDDGYELKLRSLLDIFNSNEPMSVIEAVEYLWERFVGQLR